MNTTLEILEDGSCFLVENVNYLPNPYDLGLDFAPWYKKFDSKEQALIYAEAEKLFITKEVHV